MASFSLCYSENLAAITIQKYILMLLLATETVSRTAISAIFYCIATGQGTLRFYFDADDATKTAKILGIAYLSHSAFFVTTDVMELHNMIRYFLIAFYFILTLFLMHET